MIIKNPKFVCLNCSNELEHPCKHIAIDAKKKQTKCDDVVLTCSECRGQMIVPFETRKYKVTIECEYSLDISPVKNNVVFSEEDGEDSEIIESAIYNSLFDSVTNFQLLKVGNMCKD